MKSITSDSTTREMRMVTSRAIDCQWYPESATCQEIACAAPSRKTSFWQQTRAFACVERREGDQSPNVDDQTRTVLSSADDWRRRQDDGVEQAWNQSVDCASDNGLHYKQRAQSEHLQIFNEIVAGAARVTSTNRTNIVWLAVVRCVVKLLSTTHGTVLATTKVK